MQNGMQRVKGNTVMLQGHAFETGSIKEHEYE